MGHSSMTAAAKAAMVTIVAALGLAIAAPGVFAAGEYGQALAILKDPTRFAKDADRAEQILVSITTADPSNVEALYNLGLLRLRRGNVPAAEQAWQKAIAADPGHLPSKAQLAGVRLLVRGDESAIPTLEAIIEENRFQAEARNILGTWALSKGDYESARKHARNVLLGDSRNTNALLNSAVSYYREGLYDQAALIAENALEKDPRVAALQNVMGLVYLAKDDTRRATERFLKALEIDPQNQDARLNLAALELAYGNFESALQRFDEALRVEPKNAEIVLSRAVALRGLRRYDEAERGYLAALELRPRYAEAQYNLCVLHHQFTNNWPEAKKHCGAYLASLDAEHPKFRELEKRVRAIDLTIEALARDAGGGGGGGAGGGGGGGTP